MSIIDTDFLIISGRLTRDPELQYSAEGNVFLNYSIAVNFGKNKQGEEYHASFIPCRSFGKTAELIGQYCKKGDAILLEGRLKQRTYVKDDGQNGSEVFGEMHRVRFMNRKKSSDKQETAPDEQSNSDKVADAFHGSTFNADDVPF